METPSQTTQSERKEIESLADHIGEFIQYWGFKRVHGRIWTHIFLASTPLDALDLRRRLHISKALVSLSLRDLIRYQVIEEAGKSTRGTVIFRASPDVRRAILNILKAREHRLVSQIVHSFKTINELSEGRKEELQICSNQLGKLEELVQTGAYCLESVLSCNDLSAEGLKPLLQTQSVRA